VFTAVEDADADDGPVSAIHDVVALKAAQLLEERDEAFVHALHDLVD
jgi:hypothetical protein